MSLCRRAFVAQQNSRKVESQNAMGDLYRSLRVFWMPSATLSEALGRPVVFVPVCIPTLFAALTSLIVYFKFPPADPSLRGIWQIGLVVAMLGPAVLVFLISGLFFAMFSLFGRWGSYRSFVSVTALAFIPSAFYHLAQSFVLVNASPQEMPSLQVGRLSIARVLDPDSASAELFVAASMIDVISIWVIVLLVVGYRFLGGESSPRLGPAVVIGGWMVYATLRIAFASSLSF